MTTVNINGHNHQVEIDQPDGNLAAVVRVAKKLWDETKPADAGNGLAFGYSSERHRTRGGWVSFGHGERPEVKS